MSTPVVKARSRGKVQEYNSGANTKGKVTSGSFVTLASSDPCPICGDKGHLMSDHVVEKVNQCTKCGCVAQDTDNF